MEKKQLAVVVAVVGVLCSVALALPPMGPPRGTLRQGQFSAGFEYGYSDMDLEYSCKMKITAVNADDPDDIPYDESGKDSGKLEDFKTNMFFGNIAYGVVDNWDVFVRLGAADLEIEDDLEFSYGFAWGFGAKATFFQDGDITWGMLAQMTWFDPDDEDISFTEDLDDVEVDLSGSVEVDWWEIQIAAGPTWQLADNLCIYGGPFLHFVDGDYDEKATGSVDVEDETYDVTYKLACDLEEESMFGGYVGGQWDMAENASLYGECQFTGDAWGVGVGGIFRIP
jgi:hypothetical protein